MIYDAVIIGGGVTGSMLARQLMRYKATVCVLDKENDVACGASKANSGIVHGGYDPEPDTLKAKLNTLGVERLFTAAKELNVKIKRNGSFVCAFSDEENTTILELYNRGIKNGISGLEILSGERAREIEPALSQSVTSVLSVSNAGIICPYELTIAAMGNAMDNGAKLMLNFEVENIEKKETFTITSKDGQRVEAKYLINCAGAFADKIAGMIGDNSFGIIPRAGEYLLLDKLEGERVSHTIFQVPSKEGKGILVTPTVDGNLLTGPTAVQVAEKDDTATTASGMETVQRLALKSVPSVNFKNIITSFTGVRASVKKGDFIIEESKVAKNFINVAAIDSPGLTSCVAIADYVIDLLKNIGFDNALNKDFKPNRENTHFFSQMTDDEKNEFIKAHPDYGKIVCRCENISEGEIRAAIRMNPPVTDIDGVKRRTRSGMGRCQGGFCGSTVMKLLAEEMGISKGEITKKGKGSRQISGKL